MRNLTKQSRIDSRENQFSNLIKNGYTRETYKGLDFFTHSEGKFLLRIYRGTSANCEKFINYQSEERRAAAIQNYKTNYDSREQYKAEQKAKGQTSSHAGAAATVKAELIQAFPGVKFSVRSESFAGGDAVRIEWTDGPTTKEVEAISNKYQYGHFDGMTDMYEYSNRNENLPQSKYVSTSRSMSEETKSILTPIAEAIFNGYKESGNEKPYNCWDASGFLHQIFYHCAINGKVLGIIPTGETCGLASPEVFYKIECEQTETKQQPEAVQYTEVEKVAGEINIVDYSPKAFAVIGDTKPIKEQLKALGGSFNPRLTCGAGWIFSKKRLDEVTKALQGEQEATQAEEVKEEQQVIDTPPAGWEEKRGINGFPHWYEKEEAPENYTNLQDITKAANEGKVISLFNLSQLV